jgi:hypothetical protein
LPDFAPHVAFEAKHDVLLVTGLDSGWQVDLSDRALIAAACRKASSTYEQTRIDGLISGGQKLQDPCPG